MKNFAYLNAKSLTEAKNSLGDSWDLSAVMGGGTDLIGEMKDYISSPQKVVSIKSIPELKTLVYDAGDLELGAAVSLKEITANQDIKSVFTALSKAADLVASPQLRSTGTIAGNICQRPRCWYYRDTEVPCMKKGGKRCYSIAGVNTFHAVIGGGPCHIVHPSDTAVALSAFETEVTIEDKFGSKTIPLDEFFVLPKDDVNRENVLKPEDILTKISVKKPASGTKSTFIKIQEREVWDFATASVAVSLVLEGGKCKDARVILGAAAPIPWRSKAAENVLKGNVITEELAAKAGEEAMNNAKPMTGNKYKIPLFKNIVKHAIMELM